MYAGLGMKNYTQWIENLSGGSGDWIYSKVYGLTEMVIADENYYLSNKFLFNMGAVAEWFVIGFATTTKGCGFIF